jgi:putative endonuclease
MIDSSRQQGLHAEELVARTLHADGYTIIARNYRKQYGEIDIIARQDTLVLFVEVKMRRNALFDLTMLITPNKQRKIIKVAKEFIMRQQYDHMTYQFDVAIVEQSDIGPKICYIPNAFYDTSE